MTPFDLDQFLPYRLAVLAGRVSRSFAAEYSARFGLSIAEWRVMAHLSQAENISVRDLHEQADLEKSKASRAVSRLEAAGLVHKAASEEDGRLLSLSLTEQGRQAMADLIPLALDFETRLLGRLDPQDRAALGRIIHRLAETDD